jgi:hypothetical protein
VCADPGWSVGSVAFVADVSRAGLQRVLLLGCLSCIDCVEDVQRRVIE